MSESESAALLAEDDSSPPAEPPPSAAPHEVGRLARATTPGSQGAGTGEADAKAARHANILLAAAVITEPGGDHVSLQFWLCFATILLVQVHSGFLGGFTSPVFTLNCRGLPESDGDGGGGADGDGSVPCPACLNCELNLSMEAQSAFAACFPVFTTVGALLGGWLADRLGRRRTMVLSSAGVALGWALMLLVPAPPLLDRGTDAAAVEDDERTIRLLLLARALTSLSSSLQIAAWVPWLSETSPAAIRGALVTAGGFGWCTGTFLVFGLGAIPLRWRARIAIDETVILLTLSLHHY